MRRGGGSSTGQVDWASWANSGEAARFREYTDKFMEEYPNIQVTYTPTPNYDDYHPKILTQLNGGSAPDAFLRRRHLGRPVHKERDHR